MQVNEDVHRRRYREVKIEVTGELQSTSPCTDNFMVMLCLFSLISKAVESTSDCQYFNTINTIYLRRKKIRANS